MSEATIVYPRSAPIRPGARVVAVLVFAALVSLIFIAVAALPYFSLNEAQFRTYWPRRWWLLLHITTGIVAILTGPVQLWLGLSDRYPAAHRSLGLIYLSAVAVSSVAAYYLSFHTDGGWVFGSGLAGLATAWLVTSSLALLAIKRRLYEQHKEWMIRSYVVTLGFVTFRIMFTVFQSRGIGTLPEQLGVAAWFCWSVPLLMTEAVLQGRRILAVRAD